MSVTLSAQATVDVLVAERNELKRERDQFAKDWDALVALIAEMIGNDEEREMASAGEMEEFDPWACLRRMAGAK